jgi:hypothetical protein
MGSTKAEDIEITPNPTPAPAHAYSGTATPDKKTGFGHDRIDIENIGKLSPPSFRSRFPSISSLTSKSKQEPQVSQRDVQSIDVSSFNGSLNENSKPLSIQSQNAILLMFYGIPKVLNLTTVWILLLFKSS